MLHSYYIDYTARIHTHIPFHHSDKISNPSKTHLTMSFVMRSSLRAKWGSRFARSQAACASSAPLASAAACTMYYHYQDDVNYVMSMIVTAMIMDTIIPGMHAFLENR